MIRMLKTAHHRENHSGPPGRAAPGMGSDQCPDVRSTGAVAGDRAGQGGFKRSCNR